MRGDREHRRVVLVTGASTGIGLELVRILKKKSSYFTVATARKSSLSRFNALGLQESENFIIRPLDVTSGAERERLVREIEAKWNGVDVLVNNAGISYRAVVEHTRFTDENSQFDCNYFGPMRLIRLILPGMRKKRKGHIINVSSAGGSMAMPTMGNYNASKFALEGASEALWYEMRPWGIKVNIIQPGFVRSRAYQNVVYSASSRKSMLDKSDPYHAYYKYMGEFIGSMMERAPATSSKIARRIYKAIERPSHRLRIPSTLDARFFYYFRRLLPRRIYHYILFRSLPKIDDWVEPSETSPLTREGFVEE